MQYYLKNVTEYNQRWKNVPKSNLEADERSSQKT